MLGETLALAAALTWSVSVILFKRSEAVSPQGMNLFKSVAALGLLLVTMPALGIPFDWSRTHRDWWALAVSGILGISLADTLIFMALRRLGASRLAIVDCSYAPITVGAGILFLGDPVDLPFGVGATLVVLGVVLVTTERTAKNPDAAKAAVDRRFLWTSVALGVTGIATMAIGVVLAKPVLDRSSLVEVTTVRLAFGVVSQLLWALLVPGERHALLALKPSRTWRTLLPASVLGSYISMLMWLGGFKYTTVSTASVLNQMSAVFTIVLARIVLGESLSLRRAAGGLVAVSGALTILLFRGP